MKKKQTDPTPTPVPTLIVCSLCGEPWPNHQADEDGKVSTLECIRLLKAKAAWYPYRYPYYTDPYYRLTDHWYTVAGQTTSGAAQISNGVYAQYTNTSNVITMTPDVVVDASE